MKLVSIILLTILSNSILSCQGSRANTFVRNAQISQLLDSLESIQYAIPPMLSVLHYDTILNVKCQVEWDTISLSLIKMLETGRRNIFISVSGKEIEYGRANNVVQNLEYPDANIWIDGSRADMIPYGFSFSIKDAEIKREKDFYSLPYAEFNLNDIILDNKGKEISVREDVKLVNGNIEKVQEFKCSNGSNYDDVWRFQINLPNLSEEQCKDFYVLMTRDWTSARHKVVMVKDGWLFYHLDSEDLHSDRDPNVDWKQYRVRPRYSLINNPISKGLHIANGRIYIPYRYKMIRVNKGGQLITFAHCHLNSLSISGYILNGGGNAYSAIGVYSSTFEQGGFIKGNRFSSFSPMAICASNSKNVIISNNTIVNTRLQAIHGGGTNIIINQNNLKNIGWMLNTKAITGGGERLHICDNVIEDFNYSAISVGGRMPNRDSVMLTYIIERNIIRLTKEYTDNYLQNTLADGGGIYIGPQCQQGIIRNNVVKNIKGVHSNRGIFLDDGAKNLSIYGNLVLNTANSYDIDLRFCKTFALDIPDHNTNNIMFGNYLTGTYRFQDGGVGSRCVEGANHKVSGIEFRVSDLKVQEVQGYFQLIDKR